jgi:ketosteroid isomerase-like protein
MLCRCLIAVSLFAAGAAAQAFAQVGPSLPNSGQPPTPQNQPRGIDPLHTTAAVSGSLLTQPTLTPGAVFLIDLERQFAADVAQGGGKAFASWFADDAVSLGNGRAPRLGHAAIASDATWDPAVYQLTWTPTAAQMGPSNDMGFTWGQYEGRSRDAHGKPVVVSGRYITVWKKQPDGHWRVALDASADEPPATGDCCALPKP